MAARLPMVPICPSASVAESGKFGFRIFYRGRPSEALLVRFQGDVRGYLNQCVHMPRPLDCEHDCIFDESGRHLRCSMHGIIYDPVNGECRSEICEGRALTAVKVQERDGYVYLVDKRARLIST